MDPTAPPYATRVRVYVTVGFGILIQYWIRGCLSVAVVVAPERYGWASPWPAFALSAFFAGYLPGQVPWSLLAKRISPRAALGTSVLCSSLLTLAVTAALPRGDVVCLLRLCTGLCQAATFPCMYALLSDWAEPEEISRAVGLVKCLGENGGALMGLAGSELLLGASAFGIGGLELVFVAPAAAGVAWVLLLPLLVPPKGGRARKTTSRPIPWRALLGGDAAARVVYANHGTTAWMNYLLLTELPSFAALLGLSGARASAAVATPYVLVGLTLLLGGRWADRAVANGSRRGNVRTFLQSGGVLAGALGVFAAVTRKSVWLSLLLVNAAAVAQAGIGLGVCAIFLELSPHHSSTFYAISNMGATIPGIVAPLATAWLLQVNEAPSAAWAWSFGIGMGLAVLSLLPFYAMFAGTDVEPAAFDSPKKSRFEERLLEEGEEGDVFVNRS